MICFIRKSAYPLIYNCLYFYFLHSNISNEHTYNNECIVWCKCIVRFFSIGWFSLFITEVAESASEESVGMTVSFALTLNQIAIIAAPALFGYIVDKKGYTYAWLCIVVLLTISAVSLYRKYRK